MNAKKAPKQGGNVKAIKRLIKQDIARLDKEMKEYVSDSHLYSEFTQRIENWYASSHVKQMFSLMYCSIKENVNYENFIAGLIDLNAPCNALERHILARILDPQNTGHIAYTDLEFLLWSKYADNDLKKAEMQKKNLVKRADELNKEKKFLDLKDRTSLIEAHTCGMTTIGWLHIYIKMIKFDRFPEHPGNLEMDFPDNIVFEVIAEHVKKALNFPTISFQLYADPYGTTDNKIDLSNSFKDYGIVGGPKLAPQEIIIYYDFKIGYVDDTLIMDLQF